MNEKDKVPEVMTSGEKIVSPKDLQAAIDGGLRSVLTAKVKLECATCHNVTTSDEVLGRSSYPGSCGHCGGAFRVIK